jgi:hypothetical protein
MHLDHGQGDTPAYLDVSFAKGSTEIGIVFPPIPEDELYSQQTIDEMVDSFEPVHYENLEVRHFDSTP